MNTTNIDAIALGLLLKQLVETGRGELESRCEQVLRATLFSNRAALRPNMLRQVAAAEVDAFLKFLGPASGEAGSAGVHGGQLYQQGLSAETALSLVQAIRSFLHMLLPEEQVQAMLELVHAYQASVITGFIASLEKHVFKEQELTRAAFERSTRQAG